MVFIPTIRYPCSLCPRELNPIIRQLDFSANFDQFSKVPTSAPSQMKLSSKPWLDKYPAGVPHNIDTGHYNSLVDVFEEAFEKFPNRNVCEYMDQFLSYQELNSESRKFAGYLQNLNLERGSRVAIMMPNVVQYMIAMVGTLRAGMVVVNVNPLYTNRELEHQLIDSQASVLVILENFAHVFQSIAKELSLKSVIVTSVGEMLGLKGIAIDFVLRNVKKAIPNWSFEHTSFKSALRIGHKHAYIRPEIGLTDIAYLQYTGGTTGVSKGVVLLHKNVLSNVIQTEAWLEPALVNDPQQPLVFVCALPLTHILALTGCALLGIRKGGMLILVPNARDIDAFIKMLLKHPNINIFPGVNTLFHALIHRPEFAKVTFDNLMVTIGGGMAVQKKTADLWHAKTGTPIIEGYGLSETSPVVCVNTPFIQSFTGSIGLPLPSTEVVVMSDEGEVLPFGETGEICIRGPQVMAGYWNKPHDTAESMTADGFFKSGDIGIISEDGFIKIVDRKKDMIVVAGFKVFPNDVEDTLSLHPGVLECAVIGIPHRKLGEVVKAFIVKGVDDLTAEQIVRYCRTHLASYKQPRRIEFVDSLPKTNVGKISRKDLRNAQQPG